jgi:hypothetical protein
MTSALRVSPEFEIPDPSNKLLEFLRNEWELYDKVEVAQDSTLTLYDILLSVMMNSRLNTAGKVRSIWVGKGAVEGALGRIPPEAALTDEDAPWDDLCALMDAFCRIKFAGPAVATKILHKKRPVLIPIVDSVVGEYLRSCREEPYPRGTSEGWRVTENIKVFREQLVRCLPDVERLCEVASRAGMRVTPVRAFEVLMWIQCEPNGYYRPKSEPAYQPWRARAA